MASGAYLEVLRDGKYQNVEVEHCTVDERNFAFQYEDSYSMRGWVEELCETIVKLEGKQ